MSHAALFPAFIAAASVFTITPGLDTAMVLRSSATGGPRIGVTAGLGICAGLCIWGVGASLGVTALLIASQLGFAVLRWLGTGYLAYVGIKLLV